MARGNETTTKFKVDISELKKAMQEARRQVANANSEFRATSSAMDDWRQSTEGITAKLRQLRSNLESQENVLRAYEETLEQVRAEYGENSAEAMEYSTRLNNQRAVVNAIRREISSFEDALEEVTEAERIASRTGQDVADVLADVGNEAEDAGDGFTTLKGAVATFAGNVLTGLVSGLKDAVGSLITLSDETREYRDQMNKLNSAGSEAGYGVDYVKEKYKDLYGVLADETATSTTISNFMAMNAEEETLNSLLNSSIGIWAKYGDSIALDGLAEGINHTVKLGEVQGSLADALEWSGVSVDDFNTQLADCSTEQERQKLIADKLNSIYGDLSTGYQESNKSIIDANKANADYTDTLAQMGAKIEPVTTSVKEGFTGVLQELLKLVNDVDMEAFTTKIEEAFGVLKDDVLPAVKEGLGWIIDNKDTLIAGLAGIASGFVAFKVAGVIMSVVSAFKAWTLATEGMTIAQRLLNLAMNANPIGIVVTLIATIVGALVTFIVTNEEARAKISAVWQAIKDSIGVAIENIGKFFTEILPKFIDKAVAFFAELSPKIWTQLVNAYNKVTAWGGNMITKAKEVGSSFINNSINYIKELPSKVWTWLLNTINKVNEWRTNMLNKARETALNFINKVVEFVRQLPSKIWTWLTNSASKVTAWGSNLASKGKEAGKKLLDSVVGKVKEIPSKLKSIGSDIVQGLWNGINDMSGWIGGKIKGFGDGVLSGIKDFFGIHSPSKVMAEEVGKWLPEGIAVGITKNAKSTLSAMKDLAVDTVGSARDGLTSGGTLGSTGAVAGGVVNNFYQTINSPKQLSRLDIYRQSKNLLGYAGGGY